MTGMVFEGAVRGRQPDGSHLASYTGKNLNGVQKTGIVAAALEGQPQHAVTAGCYVLEDLGRCSVHASGVRYDIEGGRLQPIDGHIHAAQSLAPKSCLSKIERQIVDSRVERDPVRKAAFPSVLEKKGILRTTDFERSTAKRKASVEITVRQPEMA